MSDTVERLRLMIACQCGRDGVKQDWMHINPYINPYTISCLDVRCDGACRLYKWHLDPEAEFELMFPELSCSGLIACGCGGGGERIRQRFEDVLEVYPDFHKPAFDHVMRHDLYCPGCSYVCWEALTNVPSIVIPASNMSNEGLIFPERLVECPHCQGRGKIFKETTTIIRPGTVSKSGRRIVRD